jgi:hypothetical protein
MIKYIGLIFCLIVSTNSFSRVSLDKKNKEQVINVLKANENLHASFFKYNADEVGKNAATVAGAIAKIDHKEIKKLLTFAGKKLGELSPKKTKKENYKTYNTVSMALIHVLNKYDLGSTYNVYSCPMVKKKWVQNSKKMDKVHNPYDHRMPHCGTKDTRY